MLALFIFINSIAFACSNNNDSNLSDLNGSIEKSGKTDITIKVKGLNEGKLYLNGIYGKTLFSMDSLHANRKGVIKIQMDTLLRGGLYYVVFPDKKTFIQLLLGDDQVFEMETEMDDLLLKMEVKGSIDNELFYENLKYEKDYNSKYQAIDFSQAKKGTPERKKLELEREKLVDKRKAHVKEITSRYPDSFFSIYKIAGQNPELRKFKLPNGEVDNDKQVWHYRNEFWDNVDFTDSRLVYTPVYHNKLERYITKLTPQVGDSLIRYADEITRKAMVNKDLFKYTANFIALEYEESKIMDWEKVYVHMVENFFSHELAYWSDSTNIYRLHQRARQMKPSLLGSQGQDINCRNDKGGMSRLFDIKSEMIVLFLYTPECEHCQKEAPELVKIYNEWKDRGVDVYALCIDPGDKRWKKFIKDNKFPWKHNVIDPENESRFRFKYNVDITPEMYVLDKNRIIVGKNLKAFQLPTIFERHL